MYGHAMMQSTVRWILVDAAMVADDSQVGYMFEMDLEYSAELHDQHKDLPFCPRREVLSGANVKKLIAPSQDYQNTSYSQIQSIAVATKLCDKKQENGVLIVTSVFNGKYLFIGK